MPATGSASSPGHCWRSLQLATAWEKEEAACSPCPQDQQGAPPLFHTKPEQTATPASHAVGIRTAGRDQLRHPRLARHLVSMSTATPRSCSPCPHGSTSPALRMASETMTNRVIRSWGRLSSGLGAGAPGAGAAAAAHNLEVNPILRTPTPDLRAPAPAGREHTRSVQRVGWGGHGWQGTSSKPPRARQPAAKRCECSAHTLPTHFAFAPSQQPETEKKAKPVP